ncbi:PhzF family phenazine biosynthesis protein [Palleronia sp. LCG004]|uniref:PhzF family phenazine biosynthesis protein n=1 Tax=Palleronia sp. LCG004 TaxID=3079304 RepID=UPI002941ED3E|nr:PhzF family phenazine biosynthesis protein [Palleronia sp. LCG004]WOI55231.1 PhzF family phenazine biosynthesis protein [Palleronia sp. LCG004]
MSRYLVYDVFTDRPFGGNPLAIFPEADGISENALQSIAREFNFSETAFVLADEDHDARIRIFTPTQEVPFAGHPLIGTAVALADAGAGPGLSLALSGGIVAARAEGGRASFLRDAPLDILHDKVDPAIVARCLGLPQASVAGAVMASVGLPFVLAETGSRECLDAVLCDIDAFRRGHALYPSDFDFAILAYHREGSAIEARMFAPLDDIPEDPATGSAAAALGAFLRASEGRDLDLRISQGVAMGRPSLIEVSARAEGVTIAGHAVRVMEGRLLV